MADDSDGYLKVIRKFDDLLTEGEVKIHIQVKSLFNSALTVFSAATRADEVRALLDHFNLYNTKP